ncbi:MAG: glycosyltransferase [Planctomycetaceae bacterium]|nr:glycosyltransferase [Planctomycetaceae bacterium]
MINSLCIIGHPSSLGGADTELDHQIRCWQAMGIEVHVCPGGPLDENLKGMKLEERGCVYHEPNDWASLEGLHCISFCNDQFLENLEQIHKFARSTTFVNCMSWTFEQEIVAQSQGWIDFQLYQTQHAFEKVSARLKDFESYRPLFFQPYFHAEDFPFIDNRPQEKFRFGRISRADADKFHPRQLWIYDTMTAPVLKEGLILGWGENVREKFGKTPEPFVSTLPPCGLSQRAFYTQCDAIIMTTDTFENLPRVGFEAMASGSILIVDDRGGWRIQVEDGVTGWLCRDDREFVYKASRCAFEKGERERMRIAAREKLEREWGLQVAMDSWAQVFAEWEKLPRQGKPQSVLTS